MEIKFKKNEGLSPWYSPEEDSNPTEGFGRNTPLVLMALYRRPPEYVSETPGVIYIYNQKSYAT